MGTLNGVGFLIHQIGGATSIQFAGLMRDLTGSYTLPFTLAGLLLPFLAPDRGRQAIGPSDGYSEAGS